jgi:hypothetical protein
MRRGGEAMTDCSAIDWTAVAAIANVFLAFVAVCGLFAAWRQMQHQVVLLNEQLRHQNELEMKRIEQHYLDRLLDVIDVVTNASLDFVSRVGMANLSNAPATEIFGNAEDLQLAVRKLTGAAAARNIIRASRERRLTGRHDIAFEEFEGYLNAALTSNMKLAGILVDNVMEATSEKLETLVDEPSFANLRLRGATAALIANMFSPVAEETASLGEIRIVLPESQVIS